MNDLDELLKDQNQIEDNEFSVTVMKKIPKANTYKYRQAVVMCSTLLGSILTFLIVTKADRSLTFIREIYHGLINYQGAGLATLVGLATIFTAIFFHQAQEI